MCDEGNIACFVNANLLGGALEQICDLHALLPSERSSLWEETLLIKKLERDLARGLMSSMSVTLDDSEEPV